ncbi:MAG: ESCRT-III subunit protein did4 [Watsoniomyces obsoletus]|nr:MAG: ESCRT-III subunit protein did4 [Watsoniomyces obsoletus]
MDKDRDDRQGDADEPSSSSGSSKRPAHMDRPTYMTVGNGSPSASAAALTAMLDGDSGYGSGMLGDSAPVIGASSHGSSFWGGSSMAVEPERHTLASHIHQLHFNQNRVALGRAINRTIETLRGLQDMNSTWPAHYPSVQRPDAPTPSHRPDSRPGLVHTQTMAGAYDRHDLPSAPPRPGQMKRAWTTNGDEDVQAESSSAAEQKAVQEPPRLVTPQIAQEFSILKLDLKLGALPHTELVHSLEKHSIASLLDNKINQSVRHLLSLRERIEDTSSKVLVTGDLNAGKSTFCNALLRRKLLPEDQQPCTSIFCEVLDARENGGIEEVHAVHKDVQYNRHDESTYDVYRLVELEKIVVDNDRYLQAKVYVKDIRTVDESLLNNGVVDIALIDAPGLNMDSLKTHAVFAREEEIDVVVFVVSAANHFTLSAKEFIWNAAREKAYIFIVVNGFDTIRDQERCRRMILEQVASLSPRTCKESAELVHFVSSNAVPVKPLAIESSGGGGGGSSGGPPGGDGGDDHDESNDQPQGKHGESGDSDPKGKGKGKGKEKERIADFENLEQSLRRFVLEKRARSKLAPAKTYLQNVLGDLNTLAIVNRDVAQSELDRVTQELHELEPVLERSKKAETEVSDDLDRTIEESCTEIYDHTKLALSAAIARVADADLNVPYPGIFGALQYAEDIKMAMLDQISNAVTACEEHTRERTVEGVSSIKALGLLHLGEEYTDMTFRSDLMFRKRRDALARQVDAPVEIWDFVDVSGLLQRQEKVAAGTGMAMTAVGLLGGRMFGGMGWLDGALGAARVLGKARDMRKLVIPGMLLTVVLTTTYLILSIPTSLPKRLSIKVQQCLEKVEYPHLNSLRLSSEVRKILRYPADTLRLNLARSVEKLGHQREETGRVRKESEVARKYFGNLVRESRELRRGVEEVDLDGPIGGVIGHGGMEFGVDGQEHGGEGGGAID